jgi:hypothetical protein
VRVGFFDSDGVCHSIVDADQPRDDRFPFSAEVPRPLAVGDVWFDPGSQELRTAVPIDPKAVPATLSHGGKSFTMKLPRGAVAMVNGERQAGQLVISTAEAGTVFVDFRGALSGSVSIEVRDYAMERAAAYPPIADQLDMIYHGDLEGWRATIGAIKAKHPKP